MEEPIDVTEQGWDESLADDLSERVAAIMQDAESDAVAIERGADGQHERLISEAGVEARHQLESARRHVHALATAKVERMLELHRDIVEQAAVLVAGVNGGDAAMRGVTAVLDALSESAERVAREIALDESGAGASAAGESKATSAPGETVTQGRRRVGPAGEAQPALNVPRASPRYDALHLRLLRLAVAGVPRTELELELKEKLGADGQRVLDDVFGRQGTPFVKWTAARGATDSEGAGSAPIATPLNLG